MTTHAGILTGIKDSEGNWSHPRKLLERFRTGSVLVGHEPHFPAALAIGGAGTICGMANLHPRLVRRLFNLAPTSDGNGDLGA